MSVVKLLANLSEWTVAGAGPHHSSCTLPESSWTVNFTADRVDTIGAIFTRITATRELALPEDPVATEAHARNVAARVTGLQEPLALVEFDKLAHTALLRSTKPTIRGDHLFYYQVLFQGRNHVTVERFQANRTGKANRTTVPFTLTHEVAAQFVSDLLAE